MYKCTNSYELPTNSPKREIFIHTNMDSDFYILIWTMIFIFYFYWITPTQIFGIKTWSNFRIWFVAKHCASFHFRHQLVMQKEDIKYLRVFKKQLRFCILYGVYQTTPNTREQTNSSSYGHVGRHFSQYDEKAIRAPLR